MEDKIQDEMTFYMYYSDELNQETQNKYCKDVIGSPTKKPKQSEAYAEWRATIKGLKMMNSGIRKELYGT